MNMPNNYKETQAAGEFTPIEVGGHYLVIKQVEEIVNKSGNMMVRVSFDTADNDKQPHYFADQFRNDIRPDKKWPANGVSYINVVDNDGKCSRSFKGFTTSVENSNPGFQIIWGDGFCAALKNKLVGGIFREELGYYNGKETHPHKLAWFCANEKVADAKVPDIYEDKAHKEWRESGGRSSAPSGGLGSMANESWMNVPDGIEDELPFN